MPPPATRHILSIPGLCLRRGDRIFLAALAAEPVVPDAARPVTADIPLFGNRGGGRSAVGRAAALPAQGRTEPKPSHARTFPPAGLPTAIRSARERLDRAIKVGVRIPGG